MVVRHGMRAKTWRCVRSYRPCHSGLRLARKASMPSLKSALP
jgi:hypothetical protein